MLPRKYYGTYILQGKISKVFFLSKVLTCVQNKENIELVTKKIIALIYLVFILPVWQHLPVFINYAFFGLFDLTCSIECC